MGFDNTGGEDKSSFRRAKASSHSVVHSNIAFFLRNLKNGVDLLPECGRNLDKAAMHPVRRCTSFALAGLFICWIALHLSGFISIPREVIMKPRNFSP